MLLPRTSIDLLSPHPNELGYERPLPVYVPRDNAGYPFQYYERIRTTGGEPWTYTVPIDASIVEIVARLTKVPSCAVVSFPFSGLLSLYFGYKIQQIEGALTSRIGDNVLMSVSPKPPARAQVEELCAAIRSTWYSLLEDSTLRDERIISLLSDTQYIQSLKRLGGLYRIPEC